MISPEISPGGPSTELDSLLFAERLQLTRDGVINTLSFVIAAIAGMVLVPVLLSGLSREMYGPMDRRDCNPILSFIPERRVRSHRRPRSRRQQYPRFKQLCRGRQQRLFSYRHRRRDGDRRGRTGARVRTAHFTGQYIYCPADLRSDRNRSPLRPGAGGRHGHSPWPAALHDHQHDNEPIGACAFCWNRDRAQSRRNNRRACRMACSHMRGHGRNCVHSCIAPRTSVSPPTPAHSMERNARPA